MCKLSVVIFLFFSLKKSGCYKELLVFFATRVGRSYLQLEKLQLEKIKTKKGLCTIQKVKTKNYK